MACQNGNVTAILGTDVPTTIGGLPFRAFPSSYLLANKLSIRLDVDHPLGKDYRSFLQELGLDHNTVRCLGERYKHPTSEALNGCFSEKTLREIVDVLQDLGREDCIGVIGEAIIDQIKRKVEGCKTNSRQEYLRKTEILEMLSWDCTKLVRPQIPRPVCAIGTQSSRSGIQEICHHIRMIWNGLVYVMKTHIIRTRTDPGVKSSLLALTTSLARFILFFLFCNDLILSINAAVPFWSSVHEFSVIEHLAVSMLVLGDWVLEPKICALRDIILEMEIRKQIVEKMGKEMKKVGKKSKHSQTPPDTGIRKMEFVKKTCSEELNELTDKKTKQMQSNRSTYFFIFPIQLVIFSMGVMWQYYDTSVCTSYISHLYKCCLVILFSDFSIRNVLIVMHYINFNAVDRFDLRNDYIEKRCNELIDYLYELYNEKQPHRKTPRKSMSMQEGKKTGKRKKLFHSASCDSVTNVKHRYVDKGIQVDASSAPLSLCVQ
ncbi:uncharacterized protein LOC144450285 [Glandiceps talaboti]